MKYFFHEEAEYEFLKAVDYYETCEDGLGRRFAQEVYSAIQRVCDFPFAWEKLDSETHRCLTDKFPYGVLYRVVGNHIIIMAIMNLHRAPSYWSEREEI